jgi:hypothetical protein
MIIKWFAKKIQRAMRDLDRENDCINITKSVGCDSISRSTEERITINLDRAIGGHVLNVSKYNRRIDRHSENTYIIRDDDDFAEAVTAVLIQERVSH